MTRLALSQVTLAAAVLCAACPSTPSEEEVPGTGLPEGSSTWEGTAELSGFEFLVELALENDGGDLSAQLVFDDNDNGSGFGRGVFTATGVHDPASGAVAFSPDDWVEVPTFASELLGFLGTYDLEGGTLVGQARDYASPTSNTILDAPFEVALVSGDGEPSAAGEPTNALTTGTQTFLGTLRCSGPERDVQAILEYDGAGGVQGTLQVGDPDLGGSISGGLGAFDVVGVHNPTTGGLLLVPGTWRADAPAHNTVTFFIDGRYDLAAGTFDGDQGTTVNACVPDEWHTELQE